MTKIRFIIKLFLIFLYSYVQKNLTVVDNIHLEKCVVSLLKENI